MIKPREYQIELADEAFPILKEYGLVYLAMEERTGKSLIGILIAEKSDMIKNVLIVTKKKAMGLPVSEDKGWLDLVKDYGSHLNIEVINYHSVHKAKIKPDLVIFDESHAYISAYPKHSKIWKSCKAIARGLPIIYMSATPNAQGSQQLYGQLALSSYSPWIEYNSFYKWFDEYVELDKGQYPTIYIGAGRQAIDYSCVEHADVMKDVEHLFITKSRADLGFEQEPEDKLHYIELEDKTKTVYNTLIKHKAIEFNHAATGIDYEIVCDSNIKLRWTLHSLEGGTFKISENKYLDLSNAEKVEYILKTWGDKKDMAIMYNYKAEAIKLKKYFKNARLLQSTSYAEGIDLSGYTHLIVYSQDFSTAKYTQRRARQANLNREIPIVVHFLLVKKAVSEQVYRTVAINKSNFVDKYFESEEL